MNRWLRILKHRWLDETDVRRVLDAGAIERLRDRVHASERLHSGEIRICIESGLPLSYLLRDATPRERAITMFGKLRVWDTEHDNGVLIYLLLAERAIEIVADRGLNRHMSADDWHALVRRMAGDFRAGRYEEGLAKAVDEVGALLQRHFPLAEGARNPNELPDEPIVTG
jgi:hypothetical protein